MITLPIPHFGTIYAGTAGDDPVCQFDDLPYPLPRLLEFKVRGDSMRGDGIEDGDCVVIDTDADVHPDSICAVTTPRGRSLKRYLPLNEEFVRLESSNLNFREQTWAATEVILIGVLKEVVKKTV